MCTFKLTAAVIMKTALVPMLWASTYPQNTNWA